MIGVFFMVTHKVIIWVIEIIIVKQAESKQKKTFNLGGIQVSPDDLHKLLSMDVSPESLNVLQKILDLLFSAYTKPKESNE